jgi:predicted transcriptional regulator
VTMSFEDYLAHYGILRKSGRYPWGSGETQSEINRTFLETIEKLRKEGMSEADIAKSFHTPEQPFTTSDLRALKSIATNQQKQERISTAQKLHDKGLSNMAIGKQMGLNESSVRSLLAPGAADRADKLHGTIEMLRRQVDEKTYLDVGTMSAAHLGINDTTLKTAISALKEEGYRVYYPRIPQVGTGQDTLYRVLAKGDKPPSEVYQATKNGAIQQIQDISYDGGRSWNGKFPPLNVDSRRIGINYKEDGGDKADGVIYVRPGVHDLDLGGKRYAQVRIAVDGTHYLKGMAVYKDDLPAGHDLVFNTNKSSTGNKLDAMKELKRDRDGNVDMDYPFGAEVRQLHVFNEKGEATGVRSAMNIVNDEGQWDKWSKNLSTQFLSKQSPDLAQQQLEMTYQRKKNEFDEIMRLTNPTVKRRLLESFADDADSSAVHLKAMNLPRQRTQVILPLKTLKDTEVYAPNFNHGERVVLVRHPHGGRFEIPELVVNNNNREGKRLLGAQAEDAIGINHKVAHHLSGADFDGDTVLVIPNSSGRIKAERALADLKNFDPQSQYKAYDGMKTIDGGTYNAKTGKPDYNGRKPDGQRKQREMGMISNLITDMTIRGANHNELAAAVRHSMVVIDAEKHHLDFKRSSQENGIPALTKKYQPRTDGRNTGGASTLISRAKGDLYVNERKQGHLIDPVTGEKIFRETGSSYVNAKGQLVVARTKTTKLAEAKDAHSLSSGTRIESVYADHSNRLKALANEARRQQVRTPNIQVNPSAKKTYAEEVSTLKAKLAEAQRNAPRERQAQVVANTTIAQLRERYPEMEKSDLKKIKGQALAEARVRVGAKKERVDITDREWEAIQAGAISENQLRQILKNTDLEKVKERATPREATVMSDAKLTRAKSMFDLGFSQAEVAAQLGVPVSTLMSSFNKE